MAEEIAMKVIARIHTDFPEKFGIPRQSGLIEELKSTIVFEPEFRDANALRGLEEYSHLWLIWEFSEAVRDTWSPMVRPPRLGGNKRVGVFATRSPSGRGTAAIESDSAYVVPSADSASDCTGLFRKLYEQSAVGQYRGSVSDRNGNSSDCGGIPKGCRSISERNKKALRAGSHCGGRELCR